MNPDQSRLRISGYSFGILELLHLVPFGSSFCYQREQKETQLIRFNLALGRVTGTLSTRRERTRITGLYRVGNDNIGKKTGSSHSRSHTAASEIATSLTFLAMTTRRDNRGTKRSFAYAQNDRRVN